MINISQYDKSTTATRFTSGCNTGHLEIIQCNDWVTVQTKKKKIHPLKRITEALGGLATAQ